MARASATTVGGRIRTIGAAAALACGLIACGPAGTTATAVEAPAPAVAVQTPAPAAASSGFDGAMAWQHLERIVGFGPRPSGTPALEATRRYITTSLRALGIVVEEQRFTPMTPDGPKAMVNLIARIPGRRTDRILITGHYDTKKMAPARFVGASDGGSSAAFLMEAARALKARPQGEFTYELVWFDGEEATCTDWNQCGTAAAPDNTYGSRHYVAAARANKTLATARAMILVDMIGDRDLQLRRDSNSTPWLTDIIWTTAKQMAAGNIFLDTPTPVEDDHMPFLAAGVPAVDLIDLVDYPYWHTPDDTLDKLSARSLQVVGDVVLAALPAIEARLARER